MKNILTKQQIDDINELCVDFDIDNYTMNPDGSIDVNQDVTMDAIPNMYNVLPIKFNSVQGNFSINNSYLDSLLNFPKVVMGNLDVSYNNLSSLEGCPQLINGDFDFSNNKIKTLKVGDYDVMVNGEINAIDNNYEDSVMLALTGVTEEEADEDPYGDLNDSGIDSDLIKMVFKYQRHFELWDGNEFNQENFQEFLNEKEDGLR